MPVDPDRDARDENGNIIKFKPYTDRVRVGIKGTIFSLGHDPQTQISTIIVKEGTVWAKPTNPSLKPFMLQAGQQAQVGPHSVSPVTFSDSTSSSGSGSETGGTPLQTGTQPAAGSQEQVVTIEVPANRAWTPTGVVLRPGELVMVQASGTIEAASPSAPGPFYHAVPPTGRAQFHPDKPQPLLAALSLLGRIGVGPVVPVGPFARWYAGPPYGSGELFLGINDDGLEDNSGAWQVRITTFSGDTSLQPQPQPTPQPASGGSGGGTGGGGGGTGGGGGGTITPATSIDWKTNAGEYRGQFGKHFNLNCPPNDTLESVFGEPTSTQWILPSVRPRSMLARSSDVTAGWSR